MAVTEPGVANVGQIILTSLLSMSRKSVWVPRSFSHFSVHMSHLGRVGKMRVLMLRFGVGQETQCHRCCLCYGIAVADSPQEDDRLQKRPRNMETQVRLEGQRDGGGQVEATHWDDLSA